MLEEAIPSSEFLANSEVGTRNLTSSVLEKRVARATRPFRSATRRPERARLSPSRRLSLFAADALPIPSGESPDGTGQWPVLPTQFPSTLLGFLLTWGPADARHDYDSPGRRQNNF